MTFKIQMFVAACFLAAGCPEGGLDLDTTKDVIPTVDGDADTDADSDADSDADTDADTETGTGPTGSGG